MSTVELILLYLILAPLAGGLISGVDRIITARMQGRVGPPVLQPFYDMLKLCRKENLVVNRFQNFYVFSFLIFAVLTGAIFFAGGDLLLVIFSLTLASAYLVMAAYSTRSPYTHIGAERELLQIMAYEPMVLITALGMYVVTKSFFVSDIVSWPKLPLMFYMPGIFLGFVFVLTIKLRKSPFDLSTSHHAHQEIVKGITTEFSGPVLAMIEIAHWYEVVFLLGILALFAASSPWFAAVMVIAVYFLEILVDNTFARFRWQRVVESAWGVTIACGCTNLIVLHYLLK